MRLVDTNILAYLLIKDSRTASARALLDADPDWHSEAFVLAELGNVLATNIRARRLSIRQAMTALAQAQTVVEGGLHFADHADALALAARLAVSAYDARFLVIASELGVPLVTEDAKLRRAAPEYTQSLSEALAVT